MTPASSSAEGSIVSHRPDKTAVENDEQSVVVCRAGIHTSFLDQADSRVSFASGGPPQISARSTRLVMIIRAIYARFIPLESTCAWTSLFSHRQHGSNDTAKGKGEAPRYRWLCSPSSPFWGFAACTDQKHTPNTRQLHDGNEIPAIGFGA